MLPFGGQGSNQAIEDGGALGFLLKGIGDTSEIPHRLEKFEEVRRKRAARVQLLSKTRVGREKDVEEQLKEFAETEDKRELVNASCWTLTYLPFLRCSKLFS